MILPRALALPGATVLLMSLAPPAARGVAPGHAELEHQVEALETLLEVSMVLETYAASHGSYPSASGWDDLIESVLLPAGLPGVSRKDPWGHAYLYLASPDRQAFLLASPGADGHWDEGAGSLERLLVLAEPPERPPREAPEGDLLLFRSRDDRCPRHCGFLRAPPWAGRTWGGAQEQGTAPTPPVASPATDDHPPDPRTGPDREGSRGKPGWCLAGEAAETWLSLRERPGTRNPEMARLTTQHGPVRTTGRIRARRTDLWVEVESALGPGWVRARYLGVCPGAVLPRQGAVELFEVDRLLGSAVAALSDSREERLEAILPARGLILIHDDRREPRDAAALAAMLATGDRMREEMRAASWIVEAPRLLVGLGEATPVRNESGGLVLWFRRDEGRPTLIAIEPGEGVAPDRESTGSDPDDPEEGAVTPEPAGQDS